jgi:hypothetical protein
MSINQKQNAEEQIEMLAAQRHLYSSAKRVIGTQMILAGPVAVAATLIGIFCPDFKNYAALLGITILVLDFVFLNPLQKKLRGQGASIQEAFDTKVLDIAWNEIKVGKMPEPELIHEQARFFGYDKNNLEMLRNWYPTETQQLPVNWSRIVCQRANIWWDSKLRRRYANSVLTVLVLLAIASVWFGFCRNMDVTDLVMKIAVPLAALYKLGVSQFIEHRDAADRLDKLRDHAERIWAEAINGGGIEVLKTRSRTLQDEIFDGRKRNPPIFDFIFFMFRSKHEEQMNKGAQALIREARAINQPKG